MHGHYGHLLFEGNRQGACSLWDCRHLAAHSVASVFFDSGQSCAAASRRLAFRWTNSAARAPRGSTHRPGPVTADLSGAT